MSSDYQNAYNLYIRKRNENSLTQYILMSDCSSAYDGLCVGNYGEWRVIELTKCLRAGFLFNIIPIIGQTNLIATYGLKTELEATGTKWVLDTANYTDQGQRARDIQRMAQSNYSTRYAHVFVDYKNGTW